MQRPKRAPGTGSISPHRDGFLAQLWIAGKRTSLGVHPTYETAEAILDGMLHQRGRSRGSAGGKETLGEFGARVLNMREADGVRGVAKERSRFKLYIEPSALAQKALVQVTTLDIKEFLRSMKTRRRAGSRAFIKHRTILRTQTVLGAIFAEAMEQELLPSNPFLGVRVKQKKSERDENVGVHWDALTTDEQLRIVACEAIPEWGRLLMQFAWGTGLRQGEQWDLELRDVHLKGCQGCERGVAANPNPHVYVRNSKNGRPRVVPLFGHGLAAARRWLEILPEYSERPILHREAEGFRVIGWQNGIRVDLGVHKTRESAITVVTSFTGNYPHKLMFPTERGHRRPEGKAPHRTVYQKLANGKLLERKVYLLPEWLASAGVKRHIRWHDLRHTCGSTLVRGGWGRTWNLIEVRDMLGHSSVKVTEMYAHLDNAALSTAALETPGIKPALKLIAGGQT